MTMLDGNQILATKRYDLAVSARVGFAAKQQHVRVGGKDNLAWGS